MQKDSDPWKNQNYTSITTGHIDGLKLHNNGFFFFALYTNHAFQKHQIMYIFSQCLDFSAYFANLLIGFIFFTILVQISLISTFQRINMKWERFTAVLYINTYPKIGGWKAIRGGNIGGGSGMRVVSIDICQKSAHYSRYTRAHILWREAGKMSTKAQK